MAEHELEFPSVFRSRSRGRGHAAPGPDAALLRGPPPSGQLLPLGLVGDELDRLVVVASRRVVLEPLQPPRLVHGEHGLPDAPLLLFRHGEQQRVLEELRLEEVAQPLGPRRLELRLGRLAATRLPASRPRSGNVSLRVVHVGPRGEVATARLRAVVHGQLWHSIGRGGPVPGGPAPGRLGRGTASRRLWDGTVRRLWDGTASRRL
mmetsp:Transcript_1870/g.5657  ORF Transcript_1870/g.5657 Transcript_1870/m.5657 type:complete len:206 (-) Transcript_1870:516-1133(-)